MTEEKLENKIKTEDKPKEVKKDKQFEALMAKIESLEKKDIENQEKLKMLEEIADKGRLFNYESKRTDKKPLKVKLSVFGERFIVGWRTLKDILVKHPTTGLTVGEEQEYELLVLDKNDKTEKVKIVGYKAFSDARYNERIECDVVGKKEDYQGNISFSIKLPEGRVIELDSRFIN